MDLGIKTACSSEKFLLFTLHEVSLAKITITQNNNISKINLIMSKVTIRKIVLYLPPSKYNLFRNILTSYGLFFLRVCDLL